MTFSVYSIFNDQVIRRAVAEGMFMTLGDPDRALIFTHH